MLDDPAPLLLRTRQKSRHVLKRNERNIERIAESHESRSLHRSIDVQHPREKRGLAGNDADGPSIKPRKAYNEILREVLVNLEKIFVGGYGFNHLSHVVRQRGLLLH